MEYAYLLIGAVMVATGAISVYFVIQRDMRESKRSVFRYLLLWPILFEQHRKNAGKKSGAFMIVGVVIMILLILASILVHPEVR